MKISKERQKLHCAYNWALQPDDLPPRRTCGCHLKLGPGCYAERMLAGGGYQIVAASWAEGGHSGSPTAELLVSGGAMLGALHVLGPGDSIIM